MPGHALCRSGPSKTDKGMALTMIQYPGPETNELYKETYTHVLKHLLTDLSIYSSIHTYIDINKRYPTFL